MRRRQLLAGLGAGTALSSPFVRRNLVHAQTGATADARRAGKFLIFFTPNGHRRSQFGADTAGAGYTFRKSLAALEPHKAQISVVKGLCCKSASDKSSHEDVASVLTCVYPGAGSYDRGKGPSIDQVIGAAQGATVLTLLVPPSSDNWQTRLSFKARVNGTQVTGAHVPGTTDARAVFTSLFAKIAPSGMPMQVDQSLERKKSVLDFVRGEIQTFSGRLDGTGKGLLDIHLESVRALERRLGSGGQLMPVASCDRTALQQRLETASPSEVVERLRVEGELRMDLLATAFACGLSGSATLQFQPASGGVNPARTGSSHHGVSHGEAGGWEQIDTWYADRFKYLLDRLTAMKILDTTAVVWASEISEEHNQNNFVNLVAGGSALGMKLGRYIQYPFTGGEGGKNVVGRRPENASLADLWVTMQKAMGLNKDTFGDAQYCRGGLPELLG